jgi:photosystem II stability/assembly factor-like uncharacterized protein
MDYIYAGTEWDGLFRSTNDGEEWIEINNGLPNGDIIELAINSIDHILAGITYNDSGWVKGSIFHSINNGENWIKILTLPLNSYVQSLATNSYDHIFVGSINGIFRSTDNGTNWIQLNSGLPTTNGAYVSDISINSSNNIFASVWEPQISSLKGSVFISIDNGNNWIELTTGVPDSTSINVIVNNLNDHLFARVNTINSLNPLSTTGSIYRSTDNGESWVEINNSLICDLVGSLAINSDNNIFIGTTNGVFHSTNNGDNWGEINSGLTNLAISSLAVNTGDYIFAGTSGSGVFRSVNSTTSVNNYSNIPNNFFLSQNYPNPFNPSTKISYSVPRTSFITLKFYDILGKEITTLVNAEKTLGNYEVDLDGSNISSGVYFYRMQAGSFSDTKKLILLK